MKKSSKKYRDVVLYYPNKWRERVSGFVPEEDLAFTWFICSKKYKDPKTGMDVAEISRSTKFYDEDTGETLVLSPKFTKAVILLDEHADIQMVKKYGYQGYASVDSEKSCAENFICKEIKFHFLENVLSKPAVDRECEIIRFSKRNFEPIQKMIPEFPSPKQIDEATEEFSNKSVCRVLYQFISEYFKIRKI
jgi:hypothetical protein